ncbi:MAG: branched-chain amino acid ABC transporter permease [Euryarchaeota archaeon]|nr:branched-chain amino acid ABC transporter permease [Euryarchaeota archaeon]
MIHSAKFLRLLSVLILIILFALVPRYARPYTIISLTSIFMYIVLTVSWALFSGPTHYISLASAAFFGIGIYAAAILGQKLPLPLVIFSGGFISFLLALLVGLSSLRLRGMYFTIFTFGLSELIRHFIQWWEVNETGTVGRWVIQVDPKVVYFAMLSIVLMTLAVAYFIKRSKFGLAIRGIGESEEAADHIGINVNAMKIITFAISTFFMGAAGATMATRWTYIDPSIAFNPLYSFTPVLMAIFGGMGQIFGQALGATVLTLLADMLLTKFPYYYMLLYGIVLIIVILFLPGGLVGLKDEIRLWLRRKRQRYETP